MHAHGVEVFDAADDDAVARGVADHFELVFLPAQHGFFDQYAAHRRGVQALAQQVFELFSVVGDAAAGAAHGETGPQDHGEGDRGHGFGGHVRVCNQDAVRRFEPDGGHGDLEFLPVFGQAHALGRGADQFDPVPFQYALLGQLHGQIQARLATDGGQDRIRLLGQDDFFDHVDGQGFDVRSVGQFGIGHDRGGVAVDQYHPVAFLAQGLDRLGAGIIELAGLADHDGAAAEDHDRFEITATRHVGSLPGWRRLCGVGASGR